MAQSRHLPPFLQNVLVLLGTLLVSLVFAEIGWRLLVREPAQVKQIPHPVLYATDPPNRTWTVHTAEYETSIRTNSAGFRGPEFPASRDPLKQRILFIGDSFLEAKQVEEQDRFSDRTGSMLGPHVETFSIGLDGAGLIQEMQFYRVVGRPLHADVVVLSVYATNDVFFLDIPHVTFEGEGRERRVTAINLVPPEPSRRTLLDRARFLRAALTFAERAYDRLFVRSTTPEGQAKARDVLGSFARFTTFGLEDVERRGGWEATMAVIRTLAHEVREDGGTLVVLVVPPAAEIHDDWQREVRERYSLVIADGQWNFNGLHDRFVQELQTEGIPFVDVHDAFRAEAARGNYLYFKRDPHFNERGHRIAAELLVPVIKKLHP